MIEAVEVVRDENGSFTHPEWAELLDSLGDMEHLPLYIKALFEKAHSCTIEALGFEGSVDEESPAYQEYIENDGGFALWGLEPPADSAVLLSIHDTEDMPVQLWAVPCFDVEAKLVACADWLGCSHAGPATRFNFEALQGIERALEALKDRTRERDYNAKQGMTPYTQFL